MALPTYSTGTVSVSEDGTVTVAGGGIWSGLSVVMGDLIAIDGGAAVLISDVNADATHGQLAGWTGGTAIGKPYVVYQCSNLRFDDVEIALDLQKQVRALNTEGFYIFVPSASADPDPSLGDDGQYAFQAASGKLWVKESGLWSYLGIYKNFSFKGAYDALTAYVANDVVTYAGSAYIVIAATTANLPPNATYYSLLASKGDKGDRGDTGTLDVGTVTTGAAGSSATVTNVGTSTAAVFDFSIPKGDQGIQGVQGLQGAGIQPDATGDAADKATHDLEAAGYVFLQTDVSPFQLWVKASAASGEWAGPTYVTGNVPLGDLGSVADSVEQSFDLGVLA